MNANPVVLTNSEKLRAALIAWALDFVDKAREISTSAKFWAFLIANLGSLSLYLRGELSAQFFAAGLISSAIGYMGSKAYEDGHTKPPAGVG